MAASSLVVMGAFGVSKVIGLVRDRAIAHQFGAGPATDAYYAAFRVPDLLFTLFAGGALVSAFLPVFAEALDDASGHEEAWRLASGVTNVVFLMTALLAAGAAVAAEPLMRALAPGFPAATQVLSAQLMRILLVSTLIFAISGIQMGILNAFHRFFLPAIAPAAYNLGILFGAVVLGPRIGIQGLAVGAVIGALLHLLVKVPALVRVGFRYMPRVGPGHRRVPVVLRLMLPRVLALGTVQVVFFVTTRLASGLTAGSLSAFQFAWVLAQMPQTILGTAVGIVVFPTLAGLAVRRDLGRLRDVSVTALRAMLALAVPAAVGLFLLAGPTVAVVLETGQFTPEAAAATTGALRMLALGLVGHVLLEVVARMYYAQQDTVTPLLVAAGAMVVNVALAVALVASLAVAGLALANSLAVTVEVIAALLILRRRMHGVGGRRLLDGLVRTSGASFVMAAVVWGVLNHLPLPAVGPLATSFVGGLARLALGASLGAAVYAVAALALRLDEALVVFVGLRRRLVRTVP